MYIIACYEHNGTKTYYKDNGNNTFDKSADIAQATTFDNEDNALDVVECLDAWYNQNIGTFCVEEKGA